MVSNTLPATETVWRWLDSIPDPEIPVITLVDLGVILGVEWQGDTLVITITPTYSGCPATRVIEQEITRVIREKGIENLRLESQISPAWSTDQISAKGLRALEDYGIAPPRPAGGPERCPRCKGGNLERISQFGSTPCKALWRCADCLEPFDYFKCI